MAKNMTNCTEEKTENQVQEQTTSTQDALSDEARLNARARKFRHIGFAIFGGLALVLVVFLLYSALSAYAEDNVYDPFTGQRVELTP